MSIELTELLGFFKFQNGLKTVLRNNWTQDLRKESSAEHSWSVAMMAWFLSKKLAVEFGREMDQNKILKMALIHDIVEIEAGDVAAWDKGGREMIKAQEQQAIDNIFTHLPGADGQELHNLWMEHDKLETIESKLVKAYDQLCPLIYRIVFHNTYEGTGMTREKLDSIFLKVVSFSETTQKLYALLVVELEEQKILV
jgi:putative hydrolase of HD superfamily